MKPQARFFVGIFVGIWKIEKYKYANNQLDGISIQGNLSTKKQ
jgi:hypothetical protein